MALRWQREMEALGATQVVMGTPANTVLSWAEHGEAFTAIFLIANYVGHNKQWHERFHTLRTDTHSDMHACIHTITLHYITLHCIALHCISIALHYIALITFLHHI